MPVHLPPRESNDQSVPHVLGSANVMDVNETEVPMRREIVSIFLTSSQPLAQLLFLLAS